MKINKAMLKSFDPCPEGYNWYTANGTDDLLETLFKVNKVDADWARWAFTKIMNREQRIKIAIFSAEQVLHIFEDKYPDDKRPRAAIEAAKKVLEADTEENRAVAAYAAYAASYAAYAADAAYYAAYAYAYAYAADAAAHAAAATAYDASYAATAYAASYAAAAYADAAACAALQNRIIIEAVRILDNV